MLLQAKTDDHEDDYPPIGTPERALIIAIDCDNFHVLAHTGRFFHAQRNLAGLDGEEIGLDRDPNLEPGYYVFEGGNAWQHRDWETGVIDDYGLGGTWRQPTRADFEAFEVPFPIAA